MRLPGSAEPVARARRQSLEVWRAQVTDELVQLRETHETVWVVGHSLGGALALDAALRLPDLVNGVALAPLIEVSRKRMLLPPHLWFAIARVALSRRCLNRPFLCRGCGRSRLHARARPFIPFCVYPHSLSWSAKTAARRGSPARFCGDRRARFGCRYRRRTALAYRFKGQTSVRDRPGL